jgi:hypothetical protein
MAVSLQMLLGPFVRISQFSTRPAIPETPLCITVGWMLTFI